MHDGCSYEQVIVIGYGKITKKVLEVINEDKRKRYRFGVIYVEYEEDEFNVAGNYARQNGIEYHYFRDIEELDHFFANIDKNTLIVSASNNYIFKREIIDNERVKIINFHNALLPDYPGRNAPSWVIFNSETVTGITWHYVGERIDGGDIICQKTIGISEDEKAYVLASRLMDLAFEAFNEVIDDVIMNRIVPKKQNIPSGARLYRAKEIPGNGVFNLSDDPEYIYRLLRAVDYGKNDIFPLIQTVVNEKKVCITRYKITGINDPANKDEIYIPFNNGKFLRLKYREV